MQSERIINLRKCASAQMVAWKLMFPPSQSVSGDEQGLLLGAHSAKVAKCGPLSEADDVA